MQQFNLQWLIKGAEITHTFPEDLMPLMRQKKTTTQARARHPNSSQRMPPTFSMPSVILSTWLLHGREEKAQNEITQWTQPIERMLQM
jgi:hypothetical protein